MQVLVNIVFILADDHAAQAVSSYGSTLVSTPNLDRLARDGVRFDRALVPNAICQPARATLLTGKYAHRHGVVANGSTFDGSQQQVQKLLRRAGFKTAMIGKWHLGANPQGFDHWEILYGQGHYYTSLFKSWTGDFSRKAGTYTTDVITDKAIRWMRANRSATRPFAAFVWHKATHRPWDPSVPDLHRFASVRYPVPETFFDAYAGRASPLSQQQMRVDSHLNDRDLKLRIPQGYPQTAAAAWVARRIPSGDARTRAEWKLRTYLRDYLRVVHGLDRNVGRVLDYLDESGLDESTLVVYASDQGFFLGEHGWFDKRWFHEESVRFPLIIRPPAGDSAGSAVSHIVSQTDIAPTLLDMAEVDVPTDMQGRSLVPFLEGRRPEDWRTSFYYHYPGCPDVHRVARHRAVITERYKLVHCYQSGEWELFDRGVDKRETDNVYADAGYADQVSKLKTELARLRTALGDVDGPVAGDGPAFLEGTATRRSLAENSVGVDIGPVFRVRAQGAPAYGLEGDDANRFAIVACSGRLLTKAGVSYDYEAKSRYAVTVKATDTWGRSDRIDVEVVVTDTSEPPGRPAAPTVSLTAPADLAAAWLAPENRGPRISEYDYRYRIVPDGRFYSGSVAVVAGGGGRVTIEGVRAGTTYEVQVRARNDEGVGAWSEPGTLRTPSDGGNRRAVSLAAAPNPVAEGSAVTVTAMLSGALAEAVTVPLTLTAGSAEPGDYGTLASVAVDAGTSSATGTVTTAQDADADDETFTVALGRLPAGVRAGSPSAVRVTIADDDGGGGGGGGGGGSSNRAPTVGGPEVVWFLPSASDPLRQGVVRVLNHSDAAGEATVTATDDAGRAYPPLTLALEPRQVVHFNSDELESGNPAKGLTGATGAGTGDWRLAVEGGTLDVEALAYVRTADVLTAMGATVPLDADGARHVAIFNPASNVDQASVLRLVNPTDEDVEATVTGVDDAGRSPGSPVDLVVAAGMSCTVDARQLETGRGLACGAPQAGLGDGRGKWRLTVASAPPLVAMSLLSSPAGHLTNLSGVAAADAEGVRHVHLFPAASDPLGRQGFVRVVNRSAARGAVTVQAFDDSDAAYQSPVLTLDGGEAVHFNSDDLELGNAAKGLTGSTGSGTGTWRLALSSADIEFEANAYVRAAGGFLTAMNAAAPVAERVHRVAFFNPGGNTSQVSVLRLVNDSARDVRASIDGTDDLGLRPGTTVRVLMPATDAVELTAAELESGEARAIESGALGDGTGKWRLRVESDRLGVTVLSLLSSPAGHLTNVSRADAARGLGELPAALLPPSETVTLDRASERELRGRWSAMQGASYDVDLRQDGVVDDFRSLYRVRSTSFRWSRLSPGTYAVRARSVNGDGVRGPWSTASNAVVIE